MTGPTSATFRQALDRTASPGEDSADVWPSRVARACAVVLPADGVGISLFLDDFRVPVGASDEETSAAERMQFTVGEGPCLETGITQEVRVADLDDLKALWPRYAEHLERVSRFRGVITIPLKLTPQLHGAVDAFFLAPAQLRDVRLVDVLVVRDEVTDALTLAALDADEPTSLSRLARPRLDVWIAVGMLITTGGGTPEAAMQRLRGYATGHGRTVDDVAADLMSGAVDPADVNA